MAQSVPCSREKCLDRTHLALQTVGFQLARLWLSWLVVVQFAVCREKLMSFPFKRILSPVDFDENSIAALGVTAQIARQNDGTVLLFHVVPMIIAPVAMPVYVDIYGSQEKAAQEKLRLIATRQLQGIKHELSTQMGEPANAIIRTAKRSAADVIVMASHGRRGFSRVMLGSVAETVLREASCPVLCVRREESDKNQVRRWMSSSPAVATPDEKLSLIESRMHEGGFRCTPVLENGRLIGIVTDRDVRANMGRLDQVEAKYAMTGRPVTVEPTTPLHEAARILLDRKINALPVLEDGQLVGVMTTSDILRAFLDQD
jgi:nucleotide-binding universal stress UspA family protein/predicted transcriptional regulator